MHQLTHVIFITKNNGFGNKKYLKLSSPFRIRPRMVFLYKRHSILLQPRMTVFTGIVLYLMLFWLAIFAVLPFGQKKDEVVQEGNVHSAPSNPHLKKKFMATAVIAAILWVFVYLGIYFDVIDFYDIARDMRTEDLVR